MDATAAASVLELHLTKSRLSLTTPHYDLATDLPLDIDVDSLSVPGGTEWSTASRTLRLYGRIAR